MNVYSLLLFSIMALLISGCGSMPANPATSSRNINATSLEGAVKAVVAASGETGWKPTTISVEMGYVLAEWQPDVIFRGDRDYAYTLEVRVPNNGKGDVRVTVSPPKGVMGGPSTENMIREFLDAYEQAVREGLN